MATYADASFEVFKAVIAALRADANVAAFTSTRIYDNSPQGTAVSPYITMGPTSEMRTNVTCISSREINVQIDVWSWGADGANSSAQCRQLAGAVEDAIHDKPLVLDTNRLVSIEHHSTQVMMDPDGTTHHAVVQFVAYVEAP